MNTHTDKTQENNSQSVFAEESHLQRGGASSSLPVNTRPDAIAHQKRQEAANNSPQIMELMALQEMANNSPQVKRSAQLQAMADDHIAQQQGIQKKVGPERGQKENNTGLPDDLKTGIENLSGMSMDDVKVHYNSDKPAQLQAHAYAEGTDIHVGPGQEKHLPHEAWHVVQQKQGRVKPTVQMKGKVNVNDDAGLEKEADVMGEKAAQVVGNGQNSGTVPGSLVPAPMETSTVQRLEEVKQLYPVKQADGTFRDVGGNISSKIILTKREPNGFFDQYNTLVYWDDEEYYIGVIGDNHFMDPTDQKYTGPAQDGEEAADLTLDSAYRNVGAVGRGVANVKTPTTLHVAGINSCIGVLMTAQNAAFVSHIVIGSPILSSGEGVAGQITSVLDAFKANAGGPPTRVVLYLDPENPHYNIQNPSEMGHIRAMLESLPGAEIQGKTSFEYVQQPKGDAADQSRTWTTSEVIVNGLIGDQLTAAQSRLDQHAQNQATERETKAATNLAHLKMEKPLP